MKEQLPKLYELIRHLQQVPYLASKNVYRVAHHFLNMPETQRKQFTQVLEQACQMTVQCGTCCAWKEVEKNCFWCSAARRQQQVVCVVETWHDLCAVERAGGYAGVYHVLGGVICPLDGIGPEDLSIDKLIRRVESGAITEVILALNQTLEGEATAAFIARALQRLCDKVHITCLSRGVPVGSSLEMMDRLTVGKAIAERRPF